MADRTRKEIVNDIRETNVTVVATVATMQWSDFFFYSYVIFCYWW